MSLRGARLAAIGLCAALLASACSSDAPTAPSIGAVPTPTIVPARDGLLAVTLKPEPPLSPSASPAAISPRPTPSAPAPSPVQAVRYVADYCVAREWLTPYHTYESHALTVLDPTYALPADYLPPDLVATSLAGLPSERPELIRAVLLDDLTALAQAAGGAGLSLMIDSGFRSYTDQQQTLDVWIGRIGYDAALQRVARPGHSEHQLGTAVDFTSPGWTGRFGDWAVESPEGAWLAQHAVDFGFVMSYPTGADAVTCHGYEPWHYRWIGRDAAAAWAVSGGTLHEFLVTRGSTGG